MFPPAPTLAERHLIAHHHAILFPTRLALARWQHGGAVPHVHPGSPTLRAAWYDAVRRNFQAWLDDGGFAGDEEDCLSNSTTAPGAGSTCHGNCL